MTNLKELDLSRCSKITDAGVGHLTTIPSLEKLWIPETGVTADGVITLTSLTNLSLLDLGGLPVSDSTLCNLKVDIYCSHVLNILSFFSLTLPLWCIKVVFLFNRGS